MIKVRSTKDKDIAKLAPRLRKADLSEIQGRTGEEPIVALRRCFAISDLCYAIVSQRDEPLAVFGVVPDSQVNNSGLVWLVASEELVNHSVIFLRHSREWIDRLHQRYDRLWNYADARNEVHIRWLKWCGFIFLRRIEKYGFEQRAFYEFEKVRAR